jgi:sulfatase maturation enzyme AslB (radical SAM superfamily)
MKCIDAYKNLYIENKNNELFISPCCISPVQKVDTLNFNTDQYLNSVRKEWDLQQFPTACSRCKNAEQAGTDSRRIGSNQWYKDHNIDNNTVELIRIDYWTGDTCNLRCAICGPWYSSAWKEELNLPKELKKSNVNYFWQELDLDKIKFIHFNGGEPLLNKEHITFLEAINNKHEIYITYNTNGTIRPTDKLLKLWEQFKLVQLDFSIDDIKERFEYQRYPAKWDSVTKNLQWFIDNSPHNCMFAVNTSVGILNYANINNLNLWLKDNFFVNRFTDPIEHRQQATNGLFALAEVENRKHALVNFLNACDNRRGTNWKTTFPELSYLAIME